MNRLCQEEEGAVHPEGAGEHNFGVPLGVLLVEV